MSETFSTSEDDLSKSIVPAANDAFLDAATNIAESLNSLAYLIREDCSNPNVLCTYTDLLDERVTALSQLIISARSSSR